jgi:beta-phosphoglucomutase
MPPQTATIGLLRPIYRNCVQKLRMEREVTLVSERVAVVFDVDGVLVDSYTPHYNSWLLLAEQRGWHRMTEAEFRGTFGQTSREVIATLSPEADLSVEEIAELDDHKEQLFRDLLQQEFKPVAGAAELIDALSEADISIAAGSSGPPENVFLVLEKLGRRDRFGAVVTGKDVSRGKPDPEVFELCAQQLGIPNNRCAVIEDAVVGVTAANRAGMLSIALVDGHRGWDDFQHADRRVRGLAELNPEKIREWIQRALGAENS